MKRVVLLVVIMLACVSSVSAQNPPSAEGLAETLRGQLRDVLEKESELQIRLQQIDEHLKPENIQRSIAHIGSLRPEELREQRRQQLEKDRQSVVAQLDALASSRARLEASISRAEALADRERTSTTDATPAPAPASNPPATAARITNPAPPPSIRRTRRTRTRPGTRARRPRTRRKSRA